MNSVVPRPPPLVGFSHVKRFLDPTLGRWNAQVVAGEYYVTRHDEAITTILGSCVSVCMRDPVIGVGGMNHFMLPGDDGRPSGNTLRHGLYSLERLINELVKHGGLRERFEVKLFGGGRVIGNGASGPDDVGQRNIDFVRTYLDDEGLRVAAESLGGTTARKLRYFPQSGVAHVKLMEMSATARLEAIARAKQAQAIAHARPIVQFL